MNTQNTNAPKTPRSWGRPLVILSAAAVIVGGAGIATVMANDGPGWRGHAMQAAWGGGGRFAERRFERVMEEIDATAEQETALRGIFDELRGDVGDMRGTMRDLRDDVAELLGAPTIDRQAAETLRASHAAAMDEASKRVTQAMLDAAEVLTPEQRADLVERLGERHGGGRW